MEFEDTPMYDDVQEEKANEKLYGFKQKQFKQYLLEVYPDMDELEADKQSRNATMGEYTELREQYMKQPARESYLTSLEALGGEIKEGMTNQEANDLYKVLKDREKAAIAKDPTKRITEKMQDKLEEFGYDRERTANWSKTGAGKVIRWTTKCEEIRRARPPREDSPCEEVYRYEAKLMLRDPRHSNSRNWDETAIVEKLYKKGFRQNQIEKAVQNSSPRAYASETIHKIMREALNNPEVKLKAEKAAQATRTPASANQRRYAETHGISLTNEDGSTKIASELSRDIARSKAWDNLADYKLREEDKGLPRNELEPYDQYMLYMQEECARLGEEGKNPQKDYSDAKFVDQVIQGKGKDTNSNYLYNELPYLLNENSIRLVNCGIDFAKNYIENREEYLKRQVDENNLEVESVEERKAGKAAELAQNETIKKQGRKATAKAAENTQELERKKTLTK